MLLIDIIPPISLFTWKEFITLMLGLISISLVVYRLYQLDIKKKAENERKKKQSTIDAVKILKDYSKDIQKEIRDELKKNGDELNYEKLNDDFKYEFRRYLDYIEYFCVGINTGIYDFEIFNRMTGAYYLNAVMPVVKNYIKDLQKTQLTAYIEFEAVCRKVKKSLEGRDEKMAQFRGGFLNPGNLKYS